MNKLKRFYQLSDIKYPWLLFLSMIAFVLALYFNRLYPDIYARLEIIIYGAVFAIALVWSILNYIGHLKINTIYKKHDNLEAFVERTSMNKEEKMELLQYLNDFVKDLEENGETHENAVKKAISHFQVQEFSEAQGGNIFEMTTHYYLLGCASLFIGAALIIQILNMIISAPFIIMAAVFMLYNYGVAFLCLFFLYKLIDNLISKK